MKIFCDRKLSDIERKELENHARLMNKLGLVKDWTGDGMLYKHAGKETFQFIDQPRNYDFLV